ncbi:hypothetical protein AcW1_003921 [Taiwanofungus camphoratus]|nr:hypothetical protein AcV7_006124 [Antrodia cinnamomea]KAI0937881.1 hypothetical protein AcW1_003921 [Antrodia cinnamomea]KAI0937882.1 hypothetical protein AcW1_003921 [Antrodia cinnamomea]
MGIVFSVTIDKVGALVLPRGKDSLQDKNINAHVDTRAGSPRAIFVLGPSSSGKTTLCNAIAESLNVDAARYVKEVARTVMKTHGFTRDDVDTYEMQYSIMMAQLKAEEKVIKMGGGNDTGVMLLSDRSAIDPVVYLATSNAPGAAERHRKLLENDELQKILPLYRESLFIVLKPVAEWIQDDGVRSLEDPWKYNGKLIETLKALRIPFVQIGERMKDIQARVEYTRLCLSQ